MKVRTVRCSKALLVVTKLFSGITGPHSSGHPRGKRSLHSFLGTRGWGSWPTSHFFALTCADRLLGIFRKDRQAWHCLTWVFPCLRLVRSEGTRLNCGHKGIHIALWCFVYKDCGCPWIPVTSRWVWSSREWLPCIPRIPQKRLKWFFYYA